MKIKSVAFLVSARKCTDYPSRTLAEIAFVGRSNVGKSSLINALLKRKKVAKVSSTPGKTRGINYFLINNYFYFVDLPGYGYAKVALGERKRWEKMIREYFESGSKKMVIMLVDSRHGVTNLDQQMKVWLENNKIYHVIVATKADKLSASKLRKSIKDMTSSAENTEIIPFSAVTNIGRNKLWALIKKFLNNEKNNDFRQ